MSLVFFGGGLSFLSSVRGTLDGKFKEPGGTSCTQSLSLQSEDKIIVLRIHFFLDPTHFSKPSFLCYGDFENGRTLSGTVILSFCLDIPG